MLDPDSDADPEEYGSCIGAHERVTGWQKTRDSQLIHLRWSGTSLVNLALPSHGKRVEHP
jgi:hypothetical protein